ncbi:MAG: YfiR family protein [Acinetobacter populi]|uniref:YfiR family protein n=1 Tax=Acinetobacter populi TaxID=1582270 RepID=UPI002355DDCF|nr:YfiR family protein [Acinetobacter populi]MCH4246467.1 YfiR family protein [Acinetobacter populi]
MKAFMSWRKSYFSKAALLFSLGLMPLHHAQALPVNANHLVSGILSYVSWGTHLNQINFCVIDGPANFISSNIFSPTPQIIQPPNVKFFNYTTEQLLKPIASNPATYCQVFYFVQTSDTVQQQIINHNPIKILTISENNPECSVGSSFCIYMAKNQYKFKVNLDSLKASQVRVNSKVLLLSQQQEEQE